MKERHSSLPGDEIVPANEPSAWRLIEELQTLRVGDFVPDGPPEAECGSVTAFRRVSTRV